MAVEQPPLPLEGPPGPSVDVGVERLLRLLWLFRAPGIVRTDAEIEAAGYPDIRAEGSVGRRNFTNDRDRLDDLGIDLRRDVGGWRVEATDPVALRLTADERDAIAAAELLLAGQGEGDGDGPGGPRPRPALALPEVVPVLLGAAAERHPVSFAYNGTVRTVHPVRVTASAAGLWYLAAHDPDAGAQRTFRIDRIAGPVTVDHERVLPPVDGLGPTWHPTGWEVDAPVEATVVFAHEPVPEWLAMLGPCDPDPLEARTYRWRVTNHEAFVSRVLAVGAAARLVGPPPLVERLRARLTAHLDATGCR